MNKEKILIKKNDYKRVLLTDVLPYEVPLIFSNEGFYRYLNGEYTAITNDSFLPNKQTLQKTKYTIPYVYKIKKNIHDFRTMSIIHPKIQREIVDLYKDYDQLIIDLCSKSPYSLRKPAGIVSSFYDNEDELKIDTLNQTIDITSEEKGLKYASSYFSYEKYPLMHKFFSSYEFNRLEKKFSLLMTLDISKCFYNIYTHSFCWAVKSKEFSKEFTQPDNSFENKFDKIMQLANYNETNGIVVGPETSRVFAEILFQSIDMKVLKEVKSKGFIHKVHYTIRRYIDDYFIFSNDENILAEIKKTLQIELENYKLYLNENKTKIHQQPFITQKSIASIDISELIEKVFDNLISYDKENDLIEIKSIWNAYKLSNSFINKLKKIIKQHDLLYGDVSTYIIRIFERKVKKIFLNKNILQKQDRHKLEDIEKLLLFTLDSVFMIYTLDIKTNNTFSLSKMLLIIRNFLEIQKHMDIVYNIKKKVFDESLFIIQKICQENNGPSLEVLNLLIIFKSFSSSFELQPDKLLSVLQLSTNKNPSKIETDLDYFQIVVLLYYIENKPSFSEIKTDLMKIIAKKKVKGSMFQKTESLFLYLDLLSCPFLTNAQKLKIESEQNIISELEQYTWFINWDTGVDLEKLLQKKALKNGYI